MASFTAYSYQLSSHTLTSLTKLILTPASTSNLITSSLFPRDTAIINGVSPFYDKTTPVSSDK
jgi:hypothetical protein